MMEECDNCGEIAEELFDTNIGRCCVECAEELEPYFCPVCQKESELNDACDNPKCEER